MMLPLEEARAVLEQWNEEHFDRFVPMEVLEQLYHTHTAWQISIAGRYPKAVILANLDRLNTQSNRIPDELLLAIYDED